jgi:hypothetical protein
LAMGNCAPQTMTALIASATPLASCEFMEW